MIKLTKVVKEYHFQRDNLFPCHVLFFRQNPTSAFENHNQKVTLNRRIRGLPLYHKTKWQNTNF